MPEPTGRTAAETRPRRVALLIESSRAYGRGLLRGITEYVRARRGWSVFLQSRGPEDPPPPWLGNWRGDGILARIEDRAMERAVRGAGVPAVDLRGVLDLPGIPLVETDDRAVARLAFDHLAERGFRRVAFCGFAGANYSERRLRYFPGFAEAAGLPCEVCRLPAPVPRTARPSARGLTSLEQWAMLSAREAERWLRRLPKPVGVMACNDVCGQLVLNACREAGIAVPDEVAVVGVDNDELHCELSDPPLSSVAPDTVRIGRLAAAMLDGMIDGGRHSPSPPPPKTFVPPLGVIARRSTDVTAVGDPEIAAAARHIRDHACRGIDVADVLAAVPLSRRALERRFRAALGRSPHEEILRVRLRRAVELLTATDLPVARVAEAAGFPRAEYMSAVFRRALGRSPSEVRASGGDGRRFTPRPASP
jgi:LacI family transcriptional regulator